MGLGAEGSTHTEERLFAGGPVVLMRWRPAPERSVVAITANGRQWGFDPDAVAARRPRYYDFIHPDDQRRVLQEASDQLANGRSSWEQEYRLVCPDGRTRWVLDYTVVIRTATGAVDHYDGYLLDITRRREAEQALRESEERFRLATDATRGLIYDWRIPEGTLSWVGCTEGAMGIRADELGSDPAGWEARIHEHDRDSVRAALDRALESSDTFEAEYRFRRSDGTYTVIFDRGLIVRDESGRARRMVGAMLDLTRQRRLEDQLTLSRRLEAVGSLAGGIAHDFNNLLTTILASAELLQLRLAPAGESRAELATIKDAAKRAAELTHALLAFARRQVLQPVDADLNEIVAKVLPVVRRVVRADITVDLLPGHELGTVRVDRGQMEQIIMNLCLNARDAMPSGGTITIETENTVINGEYRRTHPWAKEGRYVLLSVTDNGVGMDSETLQHVFEPFYTTKRLGSGVGLGLATVYGIVKQHSGMINVYSEPSRGTTVKIYVPVVERRAAAVGTKVEGAVRGGAETIMVVEDERTVRQAVAAALARLGYAVREAADGAEALEVIRGMSPAPDVVVSDVVMPRMGGLELAERVAAIAPGTRFVFTSGYTENTLGDGFERRPGVRFIAKPFGLDALARQVRELLDEGRDGG